ncbi:spoVR family protein [Acetobacter aceti NRIC 0242]|uniref:SpoVR family protein n=1 Tax=Acetobacter aceti NBRC 14818 TaxID=887700 RepID=A0AB33I8G2_ACEAC|nr:SpoVR family protein [Acetobacter aceti]TCS33662.1 stage V sporulation protein R [Acetobacter aceti NBRC 14818]BCK74920.1 SpoVR family protein [Acetobacter aceti NBRC 14818]GAN57119.1 stage V sporulation protein R/SpoVR [Acetobacter aceti NBRC 14818]GBO80333.1 spoVR family protein [Acetobacter aceti NRIC 0242]
MTDTGLLYQGADWNFHIIRDCYNAIEEIAEKELGLDVFPNRIEVITSEQMLDVYTANGMPINYHHWSYGKRFAGHENAYRRGLMGLAYEVVINSNPCISYLMEENSATMQALVIAHAAFGHNHFFKNNRLFQEWTDPSQILNYLEFARGYISRCEEIHGQAAVERVLDAAHALQGQGVNRHSGSRHIDLKDEQARARERRAYEDSSFNDLWRTLPQGSEPEHSGNGERQALRRRLGLPEENILYFLEKHAPRLAPWEREIIRIVRLIAQYFYPQPQLKLMNEGCATWVHDRIMSRLHEKGRIDDAAFMEVIHSTTNVIAQFGYEQGSTSFNPYALGFAMMKDIERICTDPTEEDRRWQPDIAGNGDAYGTLRHAWAEYRDESFVLQFLSPKVMRDFRMFRLLDDTRDPYLLVDAIHDEAGYRDIRRTVAASYDPSTWYTEIEIVDVDTFGDRTLRLEHRTKSGQVLADNDMKLTLNALADLWGYRVVLDEIDTPTGRVLLSHEAGQA